VVTSARCSLNLITAAPIVLNVIRWSSSRREPNLQTDDGMRGPRKMT